MRRWGLDLGLCCVLWALVGCGNAQQGFTDPGAAGAAASGAGGASAATTGRAGQAGTAAGNGSAGLSGAGAGGMKPDLCLGQVCNMPPSATCVGASRTSYDAMGSCAQGVCTYAEHLELCSYGCEVGSCIPVDGCPRATQCSSSSVCKDGSTLSARVWSGMCAAGGACNYFNSDTVCPNGCANGACIQKPCSNSCPSNDKCDGEGLCSVCKSDDSCGALCTSCSAASPKCKSLGSTSQCVACLADLECGAGKRCDTASNTCVALKADGELCSAAPECESKACSVRCCPTGTSCYCPQPSPGNLLTNPFFDSNISSWSAVSEVSDTFAWANPTKTKGGCPYSGSMELTTTAPAGNSTSQFSECVNVDPASTKLYYFGAAMRNGDADGNNKCTLGECYLQWMSGSNCASPEGTEPIRVQSSSAAWGFSVSTQLVRPSAASSARIACLVRSGALGSSCVFGFDQLSFTEAPDKY